MTLKYQIITDINSSLFKEALLLYQQAFPANERHSLEVISQRVANRQSVLHVGIIEEKVVCMALTWEFTHIPFLLLDYLAVDTDFRGKNIGTLLFKKITQYARQKAKWLIMEVEKPGISSNADDQERRIRFYLKNGAKILENVPYILPALDGTIPTEMVLMIVPMQNDTNEINRDEIKQLIKSLYSELYLRNESDELLQSFIHKIPEKVFL